MFRAETLQGYCKLGGDRDKQSLIVVRKSVDFGAFRVDHADDPIGGLNGDADLRPHVRSESDVVRIAKRIVHASYFAPLGRRSRYSLSHANVGNGSSRRIDAERKMVTQELAFIINQENADVVGIKCRADDLRDPADQLVRRLRLRAHEPYVSEVPQFLDLALQRTLRLNTVAHVIDHADQSNHPAGVVRKRMADGR